MAEIIAHLNYLNSQVVKLAEKGDLEGAIILAQEAVALGRDSQIGHHTVIADSLNNLAELYRLRGRYVDAKPLYQEVLDIRQNLLGESHPDIAQSLNNLAAFEVTQGQYYQAEIHFFAALNIWKQHLGEEHPEIATNLNNIAEVYREQGRYLESEQMHLQVLEMRQRLFNNQHLDIAQTLGNLAAVYKTLARYPEAEKMHQEALFIIKKLLGEENWYIAVSLNNIAALYKEQGRLTDAETTYHQALEIAKQTLGEEHPYVALTLNNLAGTYKEKGHYRDAEKIYHQALRIRRQVFGDEHLEVAMSLSSIADLYLLQGNYYQAEQMYEQAYSLRKQLLSYQHPDITLSLHNFAVLYTYQGRYQEAEANYLEALSLCRQLLGDNHPDVARHLNNIGGLYELQGRYSEAEQKYLEALAIRKNLLGQEHPDIVESLNKIAEVYRVQGRYNQAKGIYLQAYQMGKNLLGEMHPQVASILNNLAVLYDAQGQYNQAEKLFLEVLLIVKSQFGTKHPQVLTAMNNLATIYGSQGRYQEAEEIHLQVIEIRKSLVGESHPDIARSFNNLAEIYISMGRYVEAESNYRQALSLRTSTLGESHPDVAFSLNNLATLLAATQCYDDALSHRIQASKINDKLITTVFAFSSDNERLAFIAKIRNNFDLFLSLIYKHLSDSQTAIQQALDFVLKRKGLTAASLAAQNQASYSNRYPHLKDKFHQLSSLNSQLIDLTFSRNQNRDFSNYQQRLIELEAQYNNLQKQLASQVPEIQLSEQLSDRFAVAQALPANSILIEFVRFDVYDFCAIPANGEVQWHPPRYLAFILPAGMPDAVQMIDLGEAEPIDNLILALRSQAADDSKSTLGWGKASSAPKLKIKPYNPTVAVQLSQALFQPILDAVRDYKHLVIATDGNLNLLPLQILPIDKTGKSLLLDEYIISYLAVGRDILRSQVETIGVADSPLIIADPNFELESFDTLDLSNNEGERIANTTQTINTEFIDTRQEETRRRGEGETRRHRSGGDLKHPPIESNQIADFDGGGEPLRFIAPDTGLGTQSAPRPRVPASPRHPVDGNILSPAPGTRFLGESIAKKLADARLYLGTAAVTTHLTNGKCPRIMLIATHGLFLPDSIPEVTKLTPQESIMEDLQLSKIKNPMMRSLLALAGANTRLNGGTLPPEAGKGFIFAQDIAGLDLWANELTVLSACDTARGDIKIGEGVFGLRRAFAVAGVKTLVMSLWKVPDKATALLMERFFDNLQAGMGRAEALQNAQIYIRDITVNELRQSALGVEVLKELLGVRELSAQSKIDCNEGDTPLEHPFYWGAWICQGDGDKLKVKR